MKYLTIMSLITAIIMSSCNPSKQAAKKIRKAYQLAPGQVAEFCALQYPAQVKDGDTVVKIEYDFIEVECPPVEKPEWILKKDSNGTISKQGVITYKKSNKRGIVRIDTTPTKIMVKTQIVTKYVTKYVKDSAQIASISSQLKECEEGSKEVRKSLDKKNSALLWVIIALALSSIINIIQFRR